MKQKADCILFILIIWKIFKFISFIILRSSSKETQLKYYNKRWNDYLKQKEKAEGLTSKLVATTQAARTFLISYIPAEILCYLSSGYGIFKIIKPWFLKGCSLKNLFEKPINFIYLRRYNPESIKANITRLENQIYKNDLLTLKLN